MKKRIVGICMLGSLFLFSGCGVGPDMSRVKPGDEVYKCGVYSVILHRGMRTVHGTKTTGYRDEVGLLEFKDTRENILGTLQVGAWGYYGRSEWKSDYTFKHKVGNEYRTWLFKKQPNGKYFLGYGKYSGKLSGRYYGSPCERVK